MTSRASRRELLQVPVLAKTVGLLTKAFGPVTRNSPLRSVFAMGSFTSSTERTPYSDVDVAAVLSDEFLDSSVLDCKRTLSRIASEANDSVGGTGIVLWPKAYSSFRTTMSPNYVTTLNELECNTPLDIGSLDGWSGLAPSTLRSYESASGVSLHGEELVEAATPIENIPRHEWYQVFLIATRDLAAGLGLRFRGYDRSSTAGANQKSVFIGENYVAKGVLRAAYALAILEGTRPLNTYSEIRDAAIKLMGADANLVSLMDAAYKLKTTGEGIGWFCSPKHLLALSKPDLASISDIARLFDRPEFRRVKHSMFSIQRVVPFVPPGTLELYYDRTLSRTVQAIVDVDIDPLAHWLFWDELKDCVVSSLRVTARSSAWGMNYPELRQGAIRALENVFFLLGWEIGRPRSRGGMAYQSMQLFPFGRGAAARVSDRMNDYVKSVLYSEERIRVLDFTAPQVLYTGLLATIRVLAAAQEAESQRLNEKLRWIEQDYGDQEKIVTGLVNSIGWSERRPST